MTFSNIAQYFEKLESTSSRLSLIDILSNLFKEVRSEEEVEKICYLVQGRIAPFFEALEIGMAEKTVTKAIAIAFDMQPETVWHDYITAGDMGIAIERLHAKREPQSSKLTVMKVVQILTEI